MDHEIDLDLNNYNLKDLLNLFKLDYSYDEDDLKRVKKIVLMTHPDKSGLDKEYFLFYSSAFKMLVNIYKRRQQSNNSTQSTAYINEEDQNKKYVYEKFNEQLDEYIEQNKHIKSKPKEEIFNKLFNEMFEKHYIRNEEESQGYSEWFASNEDLDNRVATKQNMNEMFEVKKQELKEKSVANQNQSQKQNMITKYSSKNIVSNGLGLLDGYCYGNNNGVQYEDLKTAYTETVVPVNFQDYLNKKKYGNVDNLVKSSEYNDVKPLSLEQSKQYLKEQNKLNNEEDLYRLYKLQKEDELAQKMNKNIMSQFHKIKGT
jgi:hypothetical protein